MQYAIVAIDYFTKWVEAKALITITTANVVSFLWKNIICRFGLPRVIITDLGRQFDSSEFREYCEEKGIHVHYASRAYPRSNRENMHKIGSAIFRVISPIPTRPEAQLNLAFLSGHLSKSAQRSVMNLLLLMSVVCRVH